MMIYAPPGVPGNLCQGVDDYIASRAGPSDTFILVNVLAFYIFLGFSLLCLALWIAYRNEPRLKSRDFAITLGSYSVVLGCFIVVCARRTMLAPNGGFAMSCQVHFWLWTSLGSMQSTVGVLRLIQLLNMARFARGARKIRRVIVDDGETRSMASASRATSVHAVDAWAIVRLVRALLFSFGFGKEASRMNKGSSRLLETDQRADILALELTSESLRGSTMVFIFVVLYLPTILCIIVVFSIVDPYKSPSCVGCDIFTETYICTILLYGIIFLARLRIARLLQGEPDPDGVLTELKLSSIALLPLMLVSITLYAIDPGNLDFNFVLTWEWLLALGLFFVFLIAVPYQIFLALQERQIKRSRRNSRQDISPFDALKNPLIFSKFEVYAEENFCSESVRFLADAWGWKDQCASRSDEWKRLKAKAIANMYIRENSLLQINIPAAMRVEVERTIDGNKEIEDKLFDACAEEIVMVLKWNLWGKFVAEGGLADLEQPLRPFASMITVRQDHGDEGSDMM